LARAACRIWSNAAPTTPAIHAPDRRVRIVDAGRQRAQRHLDELRDGELHVLLQRPLLSEQEHLPDAVERGVVEAGRRPRAGEVAAAHDEVPGPVEELDHQVPVGRETHEGVRVDRAHVAALPRSDGFRVELEGRRRVAARSHPLFTRTPSPAAASATATVTETWGTNTGSARTVRRTSTQ
jgi:hypothetical protein